MPKAAGEASNVTRSLHRAVTLLRLLASHTRTGWRLSDLAQQTTLAPYFDLAKPSHARLAALARELRGTVFLKIRSGMESVCLARHDGVQRVASLLLDVGGRRPLCLTAGGVAMVVPLPRAKQLAIEAHNRAIIERQDPRRWRAVSRMLARSRPIIDRFMKREAPPASTSPYDDFDTMLSTLLAIVHEVLNQRLLPDVHHTLADAGARRPNPA